MILVAAFGVHFKKCFLQCIMAESIDDVTKTIYVNWYHACTIINVDITTKKHMQRQKVLDFARLITHAIFSEFVYL